MSRFAILIIDDEYGVRTGVEKILQMEGYSATTASTGKEALELLDQRAFDIVLIDYQLPDLDGLSILRQMRSRGYPAMTCMITAYANIDTAIAATREGVDFFLPKPFSPDDLLGVLGNLIRHKQLREEAERLRQESEANLRALATEKSRTRSLVACMRDAVLVVNRHSEVVLANAAMAALLGRKEEDLVGLDVLDALAGERLQAVREFMLSRDNLGRAARQIELDRGVFAASVAAFTADSGGDELGMILTMSDISEVRRMAMEKARFIRTMVHEFRAPLGALRSIIEVVLDRSLGDSLDCYGDFLARAEARIDGLGALIAQVLSLARIDLESSSARGGSCGVRPVVEAVCELNSDSMLGRRLRLEIDIPRALQVAIGEEDLRTVLTNLIGNAIKYNRDGGLLRVSACPSPGQSREVAIEVEDTGLGIAEENLPRLFDEFYREKRPDTRDIEGSGLGLAICKRLIERAGGRLEVTSVRGQGSTFTAFLPADDAAAG